MNRSRLKFLLQAPGERNEEHTVRKWRSREIQRAGASNWELCLGEIDHFLAKNPGMVIFAKVVRAAGTIDNRKEL